MDTYQQHQPRFLRPPLTPPPPPPATADPYYHHHQQQLPARPPLVPPPGHQNWFSNQFQFSPSPPPPQPHWGPPPPPPPGSYPAPPQHSYRAPHSVHQNHQLPPPAPPSHPPFAPPPYAQPNQEWANQNWGNHQAQSHEEDWAIRARAWADANKAMEHQHLQSHEQSYHHQQYTNPADSYYMEAQHQSVRNGFSAADPNSRAHQHQGNLPENPSVHQQEVPSSYSSAPGNNGGMFPQSNTSFQDGPHHFQSSHVMPLADEPLEFVNRYNGDDPNMKPMYPYSDQVGPTIPSMPYAPVHPVLPPVSQQHDPTVAMHSLPPFSSFPGPGLRPNTVLHPNTTFSGDAYAIPSLSDRPKKAAVPNWLKDEIKKAVITGSSSDQPKVDEQSMEDEPADISVGNGDHEDNKSVDSSSSAEEDGDGEDNLDAAKTAAINQEIKRVLTEVLLKVTDELFDEIATKVLNEDDPSNEVKSKASGSDNVDAAEFLTPGKSKESETGIYNGKKPTSSISHGVLLGLANYATDEDDEEDEPELLSSPKSGEKGVLRHSASEDNEQDINANGSSENHSILVNGPGKASPVEPKHSKMETVTDMSHDKKSSSTSPSRSKEISGKTRFELPKDDHSVMKPSTDGNQVKVKPEKKDQHVRDIQEKEESVKKRTDEKDSKNKNRRVDEKHSRRDKTEEPSNPKDRRKEDRIETERHSRKREHGRDKEDERSRHKRTSDSSRHKKRRSSSVTRDSDDSEDDSRRKRHSRRSKLSRSPSPSKSRRRQVSRSPIAKHSQRRHSPYSSLDTRRGRRSNSRSPVRRRR